MSHGPFHAMRQEQRTGTRTIRTRSVDLVPACLVVSVQSSAQKPCAFPTATRPGGHNTRQPGFALTVHDYGLCFGATVNWSDTSLRPLYLDSRLTATAAAADIATWHDISDGGQCRTSASPTRCLVRRGPSPPWFFQRGRFFRLTWENRGDVK